MAETFDFDVMADRGIDHARKWDFELIERKFPGVARDFIPMWIADMDFPVAPAIRDTLVRVAQNGAYGYTWAHDGLFDAICSWQLRRHGSHVERDWVTLSYGTVSTIHYLYQAFCQPNEAVLLNTPVYDPFGYAARHNGVRIICNPLVYERNRYRIDFNLVEHQMLEEHPRIWLLCSPHNPGGRVWNKAELTAAAELCLRHRVLLAVDEVHSEVMLQGRFTSALQLSEPLLQNLIVLTSPNKGFNLGGLKTSYSMIPNPKLRRIFRHRLEMNSITSPNVFGATALIAAYTEGERWLDALCAYLAESYRKALAFIESQLEGWEPMPMSASYLPWVNIAKTGHSASELTRHMALEAGVIIEDGTHYVRDGEQFVRLNLGMPRSLVMESLERMAAHPLP